MATKPLQFKFWLAGRGVLIGASTARNRRSLDFARDDKSRWGSLIVPVHSARAVPQGVNAGVKTPAYQPALVLLNLCVGAKVSA